MSDSNPSESQQNAEQLHATIVGILDQLRAREPRREPSESESGSESSTESETAREKEWDTLFALASAQRALCESVQILIEQKQ